MRFKPEYTRVEAFDTEDAAWQAVFGTYKNLLNSPKFADLKKMGYRLSVVKADKKWWVVILPPGAKGN